MNILDVKLIDCLELDPLITETYGRSYSTVQSHETHNGEMLGPFTIPGSNPYGDEYDMTIEQWLASPLPDPYEWEQTPDLCDFLTDLHDRGLLPAGNFIVHAWW